MVYLTAQIKLYPGKVPAFIELLNKLAPTILKKHGWKLVGSFATIGGRLNTVLDLWELPEANALERALADPDFQQYAAEIASIVEDEVLSISTKLPIG
jgi:quinol monooxygenase YgiN